MYVASWKQDSVSGNPRWFHGYNVDDDDDDSDDESSDESSDDDDCAEEGRMVKSMLR